MTRPATRPGDPEKTSGDAAEFDVATARGLADAQAGRVVPHREVRNWLLKLARGERAPRPKPRPS